MKRRDFLALGGAALMGSGIASRSGEADAASAASPARNIKRGRSDLLLLMAGQLRKDCVGAYGNPSIRTPNLDRIAREGTRFDCAYSSSRPRGGTLPVAVHFSRG